MKKYLFKRADGAFVFGENTRCTCPAGIHRKKPSDDNKLLTIVNVYTGIAEDTKTPVTDFYKENDTAYADLDELETAVDDFFFKSGITSAGIISSPDGAGLRARIAFRDGVIKFDKELTVGGFSGDESLDDGVTGDWVCKYEFPF
jgi:hypothetical protein